MDELILPAHVRAESCFLPHVVMLLGSIKSGTLANEHVLATDSRQQHCFANSFAKQPCVFTRHNTAHFQQQHNALHKDLNDSQFEANN